ncbi:MAG: ribbon-helix-helix domain-containing protein [Patescibacteria group bacterium]|nr:ribbon-helix-helix domain-containing protein [Patescibacteria group bacterium]MBU1160331.1 ribbon-helix-helix domain-containing protein [Patescibacteria group bacterium]MBU1778594.1 ribbon-helix-helix domain-containing protein [Patescibacteria group bacterium]MBU1987300.1 ribbon-helix-helix domain-containing protein [Patescibacteria group bacterium]MBU2415904.1 ribbon-helix-helix domain-containing protein [Patescibacteria group bacterium]
MITYNISLNQELAQLVDKQIEYGKFANRSEFFRQILRFVFLSNKAENFNNDWIYNEPYHNAIQERIKKFRNGKEKIISAKEFDKEFGF